MLRNWKLAGRQIAFAMILMPLATGCSVTLRQSKPIPITAAVKAIPCDRLKEIQYAAPEYIGEPDPFNEIDTLITINDIREFNAAVKRSCGEK